MKTALKYLAIVALAIVALTWPPFKVSSTEEEGERGKDEFKVSSTEEERAQDVVEGVAAREAFRRLQLQDENGQIPPNALTEAYQEKEAMPFLPEAWAEFLPPPNAQGGGLDGPLPWASIGPGNIGGRIRSLIIHPDNPDIMLAGGVSGGIWKSINGGIGEWIPKTDSMPSMTVACLAMDPAQHGIVYAGTGEEYSGSGIYKTTDFGDHWVPLAGTSSFGKVGRIAISPRNPQLLLAATSTGIYRSQNGGTDWATVLPGIYVRDVDFQPGPVPAVPVQPEIPAINCVAGTSANGAYYSIDDGVTWVAALGLPMPYSRVELAYCRDYPLIVYASVSQSPGGFPRPDGLLYKSINGGFSFAKTAVDPIVGIQPNNLLGAFDWANVLWVDPTNPDNVIVGGRYLLRNKHGGDSGWQEVSSNQTHLDHHVIVEHPLYNGDGQGSRNMIVFGANDGGIHRTNNILAETGPPPPNGPVIWTHLNHKLGVTQFYHAAGHNQTGRILGGAQDNGILLYHPGTGPGQGPEGWIPTRGGDGQYCAIDQTSDPYFYGELPNLQIYRSTTDGGKGEPIWSGIPHPEACNNIPCANASAPFLLDPNDIAGKTMLAGGKSLWRSTDVRTMGQPVWPEIKEPYCDELGRCDYISAIAIAEGNSNVIWVGYINTGRVFFTINGTAGSAPDPTWLPGDPHDRLPFGTGHTCTHITIGQLLPSGFRTVYVMFGGLVTRLHVFKTINNGEDWEDISSDLPPVPVYNLVISPANPAILYAATEIGLFARTPNGARGWSPDNGHPDVPVLDLFWMMGPSRKLVSVTHGRGIFTLNSLQDQ